jgi:dTDP-4-amino-4,6-dideoxygalactose transaminase
LEHVEDIQQIRVKLWEQYYEELQDLQNHIQLPVIPDYASNNAHLFYIVLNSQEQRNELIDYLKTQGIQSVFHYASLHSSKFYKPLHDGRTLIHSDRYTDCLLRLPLYCDLTNQQVRKITDAVKSFFVGKH